MKHQPRYIAFICLCLSLCALGVTGSGDTALTTSSDTAISVNAITAGFYRKIVFVNKGTVDGQFATDGFATANSAGLLPANGSVTLDGPITIKTTGDVQFRRFAGGSNLSGIWVFAY